MNKLIYSTSREGYGVNQIGNTMTVGELIAFLSDFDENAPIYLSFDDDYTFGGISERRFEEVYDVDGCEE